MNNRFFYIYFIGGTLALILLLYQVFAHQKTAMVWYDLSGYIIAALLLYYLAYKTYHEKKDKELM